MHSCSNSLAIESLLLNRPSYIRARVIIVTLRQPPDASSPRSMLTMQKTPSEETIQQFPSDVFFGQLCQNT